MGSVLANFSVATFARILTTLIGLIVIGAITRTLGPESFGDYSAVFAYLFIFSILADLGLGTILTREISQNCSFKFNLV